MKAHVVTQFIPFPGFVVKSAIIASSSHLMMAACCVGAGGNAWVARNLRRRIKRLFFTDFLWSNRLK